MIWEGICGEGEEAPIDILRLCSLIALSAATSIEAPAVGVSIGILRNTAPIPALISGIISGAISFAGVMLGGQIEDLVGNRMEIDGGLILIQLGVRTLAEHLVLKNRVPALHEIFLHRAS